MPSLNNILANEDSLLRKSAGVLSEKFERDGSTEVVGVFVPGRVEFLGKHTDYAGGRSLLMTVEKGFRLVAAGRDDNVIRVAAGPTFETVVEFPIGQTPQHEPGHWVNYVATVGRRVNANFARSVKLRGADIAFVSDLPIAAGMSSSSALIVAVFLGLSGINRLEATEAYRKEIHNNIDMAAYLGCLEMGLSFGTLEGQAGVGTFGGSEDHTSMLCCKPGMISQFSFAPSVFERDIPFPAEMKLVIASSGVEAVKTGKAMDKYNRASKRARKAAEVYNAAVGAECRNLRDIAARIGPDGLEDAMETIRRASENEAEDRLAERFEQFYREDQQIIPAVGDALSAGNTDKIGKLIDASHAGARSGLENLIPETDFLQQSARKLGAIAASYFGAGFGGSVWAMIADKQAEKFRGAWEQTYKQQFPQPAKRAEFTITEPGAPAHVLK